MFCTALFTFVLVSKVMEHTQGEKKKNNKTEENGIGTFEKTAPS